MGIVVTTDVFCDKCTNWAHYHGGNKSKKTEALNAALKSGWKLVPADGGEDLICPCCTGAEPDYWQSWFKGDRGLLQF